MLKALAIIFVLSLAANSDVFAQTVTEEPIKIIDVQAHVRAKLASMRAANMVDVSWFISENARPDSSPWNLPGMGSKEAAARFYGPHFLWHAQNMRQVLVTYSLGEEQTLPGGFLESKASKVFLHANCSGMPIPFKISFSEQLKEQTTWSFKQTIDKSWTVKLGFDLGIPRASLKVSGETSETNRISTDQANGTLKEEGSTWTFNREAQIQPYWASRIQIVKEVKRLRVPFSASILMDADVMVQPSKADTAIFYSNLSALLPDQSDRTFLVEGYIEDVSLGTENVFIYSKEIDDAIRSDPAKCNSTATSYWESVLAPSMPNAAAPTP